MKKIILINLLLVLSMGISTAQSNLRFSRVVRNAYTGTSPTFGYIDFLSTTLVVPQGKVLKIESAAVKRALASDPNSIAFYNYQNYDEVTLLVLDNIPLISERVTYFSSTQISQSPNANAKFPIWLPQGTYSIKLSGYVSGNPSIAYGMISGIEFDVVP
jgi:hypothetical protein